MPITFRTGAWCESCAGQEKNLLVTFSCNAAPDITMFGDVAVQLLKLMGHSGTVPGALLAADVPAALARLKSGTAAAGPPPIQADNEEPDEPPVSLATRAYPLIGLLEAAAREEADVMWEQRSHKYIQTS